MTREESLKLAQYEETPYYFQRLINKIYDDFENRKCEKCAFNQGFGWCRAMNIDNAFIDKGCNLYELEK